MLLTHKLKISLCYLLSFQYLYYFARIFKIELYNSYSSIEQGINIINYYSPFPTNVFTFLSISWDLWWTDRFQRHLFRNKNHRQWTKGSHGLSLHLFSVISMKISSRKCLVNNSEWPSNIAMSILITDTIFEPCTFSSTDRTVGIYIRVEAGVNSGKLWYNNKWRS